MIPSLPRSLAPIRTRLRRLRGELPRRDELYSEWSRGRLEERPFINIGAGKFSHPWWRNVDYGSEWYAKVQKPGFVEYDLTARQPLPMPDASISLAYTSHTIEHVDDASVENLFREVHRVLEPGGAFRVTCPDALLLHRSVSLGRRSYWRWRHPWFRGRLSTAPDPSSVTVWDFLIREIATARCRFYVHAVDPIQPEQAEALFHAAETPEAFLDALVDGLEFDSSRPGDHINWWHERKVMDALQAAGFETVYASRRGQSLFEPMTDELRFDTTQPVNSLYVEAIRGPGEPAAR
ncbi:MAG: methyltransferase domain-containing protein [Myxococcales bacterium]|jgi:SAM-dependent methyltransferase